MLTTSLESERLYTAALLAIPELGSRSIRALVALFGSAKTVWETPASTLQEAAGLSAKTTQSIQHYRPDYDWDKQLHCLQAYQVHLVSLWEDSYPAALQQTFNPPVILYYRGQIPQTNRTAAIVGARKATPYGLNVSQTIAADMARHQITVVSGGARGIDTKAHQGALSAKGKTIAVIANGLDIAYPSENKRLFAEIADTGGAVISEYPFGMRPLAVNFPARNRIIAGLCRCTVVVEAALRSGSLITADFALEEGRDIFAVPGSIYSTMSKGTHELIRKGAIILTQVEDILQEYGWDQTKKAHASKQTYTLTLEESAVLNALSYDEAMSREILTIKTKFTPSQLSPIILKLQLQGFVEEINNAWIRKGNV